MYEIAQNYKFSKIFYEVDTEDFQLRLIYDVTQDYLKLVLSKNLIYFFDFLHFISESLELQLFSVSHNLET